MRPHIIHGCVIFTAAMQEKSENLFKLSIGISQVEEKLVDGNTKPEI